jgi:hypothetical protein
MKKGTCESGKMGRRPVAFESAQGSAIDRRRGRQGGGQATRGEYEEGALVLTGGGQRGWCGNGQQRPGFGARGRHGVSAQWGGAESLASGA